MYILIRAPCWYIKTNSRCIPPKADSVGLTRQLWTLTRQPLWCWSCYSLGKSPDSTQVPHGRYGFSEPKEHPGAVLRRQKNLARCHKTECAKYVECDPFRHERTTCGAWLYMWVCLSQTMFPCQCRRSFLNDQHVDHPFRDHFVALIQSLCHRCSGART